MSGHGTNAGKIVLFVLELKCHFNKTNDIDGFSFSTAYLKMIRLSSRLIEKRSEFGMETNKQTNKK